jgi:TRAP-type C4-dicarboxylate transport system permease small subunit
MADSAPVEPEVHRDPLARLSRAIAFLGALIAGIALVWVMLAVTLDVASRNFRGRSISGITDRTEAVLVFVVFLAMAYTQVRKEHVAVEAVVNRLGRVPRKIVHVLAFMLALAGAGILAYAATKLAIRQYGIREVRIGIAEVAIWPSRIAAAVGLWMWSLQYFSEGFSLITRKEADADDGVYTFGPL